MPDLTLAEAAAVTGVDLPVTRLSTKLTEVAAEVTHVEKDGFNDFQKYKYTSAEAMLGALRKPLIARGVVLLEEVVSVEDREYKTVKDKSSVITTVTLKFTFIDGESGERLSLHWLGRGDDPADKGLGKAYTNAVKTFLRAQFLIPQGDDPEADTSTDARAAERGPQGPPAPRKITAKQAKDLAKRVADAGLLEKLSLAVGHVTGTEFPDVTDEEHAATKLKMLDTAQAARIEKWVRDKTEQQDVPA